MKEFLLTKYIMLAETTKPILNPEYYDFKSMDNVESGVANFTNFLIYFGAGSVALLVFVVKGIAYLCADARERDEKKREMKQTLFIAILLLVAPTLFMIIFGLITK